MGRSDELDLLTALHDGVHQEPRWRDFLPRLRRRLRADHVSLTLAQGGMLARDAPHWCSGNDPGTPAVLLPDNDDLDAALLSLRPERVYGASELMPPDERGRERLHEHLARSGARFGRYMRVVDGKGRSAWLAATCGEGDFSAAEGALLSAMAPHLTIALRTLGELERLRYRCAVGEDALVRAGIGWQSLDRAGKPIEGGGAATGHATAAVEVPAPAAALGAAVHPVSTALTRAAPPPGHAAAAVLARQFGLSGSEARLAIHLAAGLSLAEACAALGLTIETARNYSKRVFAKTATRGQPDLVRLVLTGVAGIA